MKEGFKSAVGLAFFFVIRGLERLLSPGGFYLLWRPLAFTRATLNNAFKKPKPSPPLPGCFHFEKTARLARRQRADFYLNHMVEFFPDRLAGPRWLTRCRFEGLENVRRAVENKKPVVLATCHFGPYYLFRFWLRAAGIPALELFGGDSKKYTKLMRFRDRLSPLPEIPPVFFQNQLREMNALLAGGNVIGLMIDTPFGKQMDAPFCDGWTFQMATGAVRMAILHQAELVPCLIVDEGRWHFRLHFGRPVPKEFLNAPSDWNRAGKYLLEEMTPIFQAHPEQCLSDLTRCLKRAG
jgi:lauroyl/myristoyl acyltransferase